MKNTIKPLEERTEKELMITQTKILSNINNNIGIITFIIITSVILSIVSAGIILAAS